MALSGGKKRFFGAGGGYALLIMPCPLSRCQIKAVIKGFLLRHRLFQCKHCFLPNFELKDFSELTFTSCIQILFHSDHNLGQLPCKENRGENFQNLPALPFNLENIGSDVFDTSRKFKTGALLDPQQYCKF